MLPSETMIWQPEFTDKTLSRKPGAVHNSSWTTIYDSGALAKTNLTAGKRVVSAKVPAGVQRYLRVNYSVATGPLTAGEFTAGISLDVDANTSYPIRSKVTG
ncbi:hypothetical protein BvCmsKSP093_03474 [Escherichia coli]|nr:hypothetical protein BvCmsKSP093_03474 [Escherichia coli]